MNIAILEPTASRPDPLPRFFDPELIITPEGNPAYSPAMLADLMESVREHGQLVPGWVYPSPDLPPEKRFCLEGNRRLAVARALGKPFWAFDRGRFVQEAERIKLTFQHNHSRRVMSRDEIAERAARYIELTGCTHGEAAQHLNISGTTLSRAFGERRIPPEYRSRAERLGLSVRSLIAAAPLALMGPALDFAEVHGEEGRRPTRDEVAAFIARLKKGSTSKGTRVRTVTLRHNGRAVTVAVAEKDSAFTVSEDMKALAGRLAKYVDVPPEGWPFLFQ